MRTIIRQSTFETNSSSVHAIVFIPNEVIDLWSAPEHRGDWLDFGVLLDEAGIGRVDSENMDVPVIAREDILVPEADFQQVKDDREDIEGYGIHDDEAVGMFEMIPYDLLVQPERYTNTWGQFPTVEVQGDGIIVEMDYEGSGRI